MPGRWRQHEPQDIAIHGPALEPTSRHILSLFRVTKNGEKLDSDWTFNIDDTNARSTVPPDEVSLPVRQAADELRHAMDACRSAAIDLGDAVRTASQAGYGTKWLLGAASLSTEDLERVLRGEELF